MTPPAEHQIRYVCFIDILDLPRFREQVRSWDNGRRTRQCPSSAVATRPNAMSLAFALAR
jgi:hypothetical protein